jgi:hypothetical protein
MAYAILFKPASMTAQQYDECLRLLDAAGASAPKGRIFHACHGEGSDLRVFDIWESMETFQAFGPTLMPILHQIGVDPGQPDIRPLHRTIDGAR